VTAAGTSLLAPGTPRRRARLLVLTHFSQRYDSCDAQRPTAEAAMAFGGQVVLTQQAGFRSAFALLLWLREVTLGALNLLSADAATRRHGGRVERFHVTAFPSARAGQHVLPPPHCLLSPDPKLRAARPDNRLPPMRTESYGRPVGVYMVMVRRARLRAVPPGLGMAPPR
jgi:hypothetical protein